MLGLQIAGNPRLRCLGKDLGAASQSPPKGSTYVAARFGRRSKIARLIDSAEEHDD